MEKLKNNKPVFIVALALSVFMIYTAGKNFGEFLYYLLN